MIEFEIKLRQRMNDAAKEDRERFFVVADTLQFQPKYKDKLTEIDAVKQQWRDMTLLPDYPNIDFPLVLPEWFPKVVLCSSWKKNEYIKNALENSAKAGV